MLEDCFRCPMCQSALSEEQEALSCASCGRTYPIIEGIPRFVQDDLHSNFALQWRLFAHVQLDSVNGSGASHERLLNQSRLSADDFCDQKVLEVGCGAGRFTEVLLEFGSKVVACDYSTAVEVCAENNASAVNTGDLRLAQADVFMLPFKPEDFDIVIGYGMLQHTGNPRAALTSLWRQVRPGGLLLVDRYQIGVRAIHPIKYLVRPVARYVPERRLLNAAKAVSTMLVPAQRWLLRHLPESGPLRVLRHVINRSPNSTYPINLELSGSLPRDMTVPYSTMDTFDMWAPRYDRPQTFRAWRRDLERLPDGRVIHCVSEGQGNVGVVRRDGPAQREITNGVDRSIRP